MDKRLIGEKFFLCHEFIRIISEPYPDSLKILSSNWTGSKESMPRTPFSALLWQLFTLLGPWPKFLSSQPAKDWGQTLLEGELNPKHRKALLVRDWKLKKDLSDVAKKNDYPDKSFPFGGFLCWLKHSYFHFLLYLSTTPSVVVGT